MEDPVTIFVYVHHFLGRGPRTRAEFVDRSTRSNTWILINVVPACHTLFKTKKGNDIPPIWCRVIIVFVCAECEYHRYPEPVPNTHHQRSHSHKYSMNGVSMRIENNSSLWDGHIHSSFFLLKHARYFFGVWFTTRCQPKILVGWGTGCCSHSNIMPNAEREQLRTVHIYTDTYMQEQ